MCLDNGPLMLVRGETERQLDNIASLLPKDGSITLIDVFGKKEQIEGVIEEIDLLNNRIVLA
ncbi:putative RNA-binding protein [Geothermobacter ehrlichii]|uniref:Putative RNA-binding protein n=1 Tax=Geothermobacter ehrlichii TaxID=213224 RepID=A0A5D3WIR1_9BACT|nr:CooT family nickel-binding protein [Geothermobacter ehrlichii]TYO97079.1 putative RNA-binding protein [Geothermobacter ehrlichii]